MNPEYCNTFLCALDNDNNACTCLRLFAQTWLGYNGMENSLARLHNGAQGENKSNHNGTHFKQNPFQNFNYEHCLLAGDKKP